MLSWSACHTFYTVGVKKSLKKGKVCIRAKWLIRLELIPVSVACACSKQEYFYSPIDGMLVHQRVTPSIKLNSHLYTWVERGTIRVKCLAQHNAMSLTRAHQTRTTCLSQRKVFEVSLGVFSTKGPQRGLLGYVRITRLVISRPS